MKSNMASCYIQIKTCLVKPELTREATEITKVGRVESSCLLWYGQKHWELRIWL